MGVTGPENDDSDRAYDYLAIDVVGPIVGKLRSVLDDPELAQADDPDCDKIVTAVEVLAVLYAHFDWLSPPATRLVERCRDTFLSEWDTSIDELNPAPGHKEERRAVIVGHFDRLIRICEAAGRADGPREFG
jgi:hypothetical protein